MSNFYLQIPLKLNVVGIQFNNWGVIEGSLHYILDRASSLTLQKWSLICILFLPLRHVWPNGPFWSAWSILCNPISNVRRQTHNERQILPSFIRLATWLSFILIFTQFKISNKAYLIGFYQCVFLPISTMLYPSLVWRVFWEKEQVWMVKTHNKRGAP